MCATRVAESPRVDPRKKFKKIKKKKKKKKKKEGRGAELTTI